jgi:predicted nucleotidyltransferase component of viral defense system
MNLHTNKELLRNAIQATAQSLNLREIYVEKDYWVTVALYEIFHSDMAHHTVFKGGTALSKCYKLIERFSEDIDIVALRGEGETDNQMKRKIQHIGETVSRVLPEIEVPGLSHKRGNIRKTVHHHAKQYAGNFGQVREHVVLEATWLGNFEPYATMPIQSYISEMMRQTGQQPLLEQYKMGPFDIQVLGKERTLCEKIMSLVRFSKTEAPIADLRNKIRHIYDIHQMLLHPTIESFFQSMDFDEMLLKVGYDDLKSFKNNNAWLSEHPASAILFKNTAETWTQLVSEYNGNFKDMVTGALPLERDVLGTLRTVAARLNRVDWKI